MFNQTAKKKGEEKPLNYWQRKKAEKMAEDKKKTNIFLSRLSGEGSGASTAYQASQSTFASGEIKSRSRVSMVGKGSDNAGMSSIEKARSKACFAQGAGNSSRSGFAKAGIKNSASGISGNRPPSRPIGL
jgi:hypothetical protein